MKEIKLTKGKVALVSDEDFEKVSKFKWGCQTAGRFKDIFYAYRKDYSGEKERTVYMHRFLLDLQPGDGWDADHINGNGLDNQRGNLRKATRSQNARNQRKSRDNTTGFKGVSKARNGTYVAHITIKYKAVHIGTFKTPEEASLAYEKRAKQVFGDFYRESHYDLLGIGETGTTS